ncbi:MAG: DUF2255 family protein [Pseudonocardiaceae bacterium]
MADTTDNAGNPSPSAWPTDTLDRFGAADEIEISTCRSDGSLRTFVPIWIVAVDGTLYVRSYRGPDGAWYRHATDRPAGAIRTGGQQADVTCTPIDPRQRDLLTAIGDAYLTKYARYGETYLQPMLAEQAVVATLRLDPRN